MTSTNRFLTTLQLLFKVRPGEGKQVLMMFVYSLVAIGGGVIIGRSVSRTLFLSQLPESLTPYKYILPPLVVMSIMTVYTRLTTRFRLSHLIIGLSLLMSVGVLIFRILLGTTFANSFVVLASLFVFTELLTTLVSVQFWTYASDIFDARQARRLFGLITTGGVMASVLAGIGMQVAAATIAPKDLLFGVALSLMCCAGIVYVLERQRDAEEASTDSPPFNREPKSASLRQDLRTMRHTPLLVSLAGIIIIMSLVTNIGDYQLDLSLQRFFSADGSGMLAFLGRFELVTGLLAIALQLLITGRLMERFGLVASLLILPVSIALGSGMILATGGMLLAAAWPRGSEKVWRFTVNDAAINALFLPIPPALRQRTKAILQGIMKPPLAGLLGLLFLFFRVEAGGAQVRAIMAWSVPALILVAVWVFLVWRMRDQYRTALSDSLRRRQLDLSSTEVDISDEAAVQVLVQSLRDPDALQVIHVLELIRQAPTIDWLPHIVPLHDHPSPEVRLMTLQWLSEARSARYGELIAGHFMDDDPQVRATAIDAYCNIYEDAAIEKIAGFLDEDDLSLRNAAIVGLIRHGGLDGILQAVPHLMNMLSAESESLRAQGVQILGHLGLPNFYRSLLPALNDPSLQVKLAATRAAGQLRHPALIPHLIAGLGRVETKVAATDALVAFGPDVVQSLGAAWENDEDASVRLQIPRVLQQIPAAAAVQLLATHIEDEDAHLRGRTLKALTILQRRGVPVEINEDGLQRALLGEARHYYELSIIYDDLGREGRGILLDEMLRWLMQFTIDRLFYLLALLHPKQNMAQLQRGLAQGDARLRANAIELLDTLLTREIKELVLPLIEAGEETIVARARDQLGIPSRSTVERLAELMQYPSDWLQSCVLYQIGSMRLSVLKEQVIAGLFAEDDVVRETAFLAGNQLLSPAELKEIMVNAG